MGRLLKYLLPYKKRLIALAFVSIIVSIMTLMDAWILGRLSDAIFYQTKGIPISISWEKRTDVQYRLSFIKSLSWDKQESTKVIAELNRRGFKILRTDGINSKTLILNTVISKELIKEPLNAVNDIQNRLKKHFGNVQVFIAPVNNHTSKPELVFFGGMYTIFLLPILFVILWFFKGVFKYAQSFLLGSTGQKLVMKLRNEIYQNLQNLSISYFEKNKSGQSGQLISRVTNDIDAVNRLFSAGIMDMFLEPLMVVMGLAWGFFMNWRLTLMFFLIFPFVAWPVNKLSRKLRSVNLEIMNKVADITGVLEETFSGIKVVKAFGMEKYEINRFKRETRQSYHASLRGLRLGTIFSPVIDFLISLALAIFLIYGGVLILDNRLSPAEFLTFVFLMSVIGNPIRRVSGLFSQLPRVMAAADRVFEIIDQKSDVTEAPNAIELSNLRGQVEFDNVTFGYEEDKKVLHQVNLFVQPGEVIAFVGPSGAGKTTMINLIARFYDPLSGTIKLDGMDLRQVKLDSVRSQMGIVPQETILFRGTIMENIAYGKVGASEAEIVTAAKAANAHEFIEKMPEQYETRVGARGATLSGGQRQRIAIARAILRNPKILILDEATSALDTQSEVLVQEALQRLMKDRTSFVIAHRLSTIRSAHRIVVMNNGKIVEIGTHEELLEKDGLYAVLYKTQFRNQEVEKK